MSDGFSYADFAAALLAPEPDARPAWLSDDQVARFAVYRNNLHHGLGQALGEAYPVVRRLVGDDFFKATARLFIAAVPPRQRSLALYGDGFADFLDGFEPAQAVPYLADVARLERAWLESLHAADAAPLAPETLADLDEALATTRFEAHPAARLIHSEHPVVSIWQANQDDATGGEIEDRPEAALICRARDTVTVRALSAADGAFAAALLDCASAAEAACDGADVVGVFQVLLTDGAFTALHPEH
ncbi:MAG: DNA-binding domain-containing protein [Alphaproteobacteria bacterium]